MEATIVAFPRPGKLSNPETRSELELKLTGTLLSIRAGHQVYSEGDPVRFIYKVMSGAVRGCKFLLDGRRLVSAFYLPGETFGLELNSEHRLATEAISDVKLLAIKRSLVDSLAAEDPEIAGTIWRLAGEELRRALNHTLLLKRTAPERVASFLLEMAGQLQTGEVIELPMSRQDIADYLGLTIETVSRTLTNLERTSAIALSKRTQIAFDQTALRRLVS